MIEVCIRVFSNELLSLALMLTCFALPAQKIKDYPVGTLDVRVEVVYDDFDNPWSFNFLPDGALIVTEKKGELYHLKDGTKTLIQGLPEVYVRGQGGLMDVVLHPDYETNGWIYFSYGTSTNSKAGGNTTLARAKLAEFELTDVEVLFNAKPVSRKGVHWGGRIVFDADGLLYLSVGDRGARDDNPQSLSNHSGKVHRLNADGSIPDDNPFIDQEGAVASIFSYGHRNPQGMDVHPETGEVWAHEHGPKGGDELNVIRAANNYGWPVISYGVNYSGTSFTDLTEKEGMQQPIKYWVPSIAPCGMAFVTSDLYGDWKGSALVGSLKFNYLHRVVLEENQMIHEEKVMEEIGRVRTIRQGPDGLIYVSLEGKGIVRLQPAP